MHNHGGQIQAPHFSQEEAGVFGSQGSPVWWKTTGFFVLSLWLLEKGHPLCLSWPQLLGLENEGPEKAILSLLYSSGSNTWWVPQIQAQAPSRPGPSPRNHPPPCLFFSWGTCNDVQSRSLIHFHKKKSIVLQAAGPLGDAHFVSKVALVGEVVGQKCKSGLRLPLQQNLGHLIIVNVCTAPARYSYKALYIPHLFNTAIQRCRCYCYAHFTDE